MLSAGISGTFPRTQVPTHSCTHALMHSCTHAFVRSYAHTLIHRHKHSPTHKHIQVIYAILLVMFIIDKTNEQLRAEWLLSWMPGYISSVCVFTITVSTEVTSAIWHTGRLAKPYVALHFPPQFCHPPPTLPLPPCLSSFILATSSAGTR